jgi:hypothetical protein
MRAQVKNVFYVKRTLRNSDGEVIFEPSEKIGQETIIVHEFGVILYSEIGIHSNYRDLATYINSRFQHAVEDIETDIMIVDQGEI